MIILLPWPPRELSPNARVHWSTKAKQAAQYKAQGWVSYNEAKKGESRLPQPNMLLELRLTLHPPTRAARDIDNIIAQIKPAIDGIFRGIGGDDSQIRQTMAQMAHPVKGGQVVVEVLPLARTS
ncbi:MAG: hypothetical protein KGN37_17370 [Burkholderiales bacterium]|nr:hypothetical protein [Burkholderiales bacterium]